MDCGVSLCVEESTFIQAVAYVTQKSSPSSCEEFARSCATAVLPSFMAHAQKLEDDMMCEGFSEAGSHAPENHTM